MMKLVTLSLVVMCGWVAQVYSDCSAADIATVQQQFSDTFGSDSGRLAEFGQAVVQRSEAHHVLYVHRYV